LVLFILVKFIDKVVDTLKEVISKYGDLRICSSLYLPPSFVLPDLASGTLMTNVPSYRECVEVA